MTELYHHGIKGQKWGVRRYQNPDGSYTEEGKKHYGVTRTFNNSLDEQTKLKVRARNGDDLLIEQEKHTKTQRLIAKGIEAAHSKMMNSKIFSISSNNKKVGDIQLFQESDTSVNFVWLGINSKERGKGYAQAVMDETINECKRRGYEQITLEVPGNSPDARHIYEKFGFKVEGQLSSADEDFIWGGLTSMRLDLTK